MDREAQAEAWFRKKPRRIIQSQTLIAALLCLTAVGTIPLGGALLQLVFCFYPSVIIPVLLIFWMVSSAVYVVGRLYYKGR